MTRLIQPADGAVLSLQTEIQKQFLREAAGQAVQTRAGIDWLHLERTGERDHSLPGPVVLTFETDAEESVLEWSYAADLTGARTVRTKDKSAALVNLIPGETVYWRVNGSEVRFFRTADEYPRFIGVDSLSNIRDTGGWRTEDGHRIRFGKIYRGGEMDRHQVISEKGTGQMLGELGIRTDLDIRLEAEGREESPLGPSVGYRLVIPFLPYHGFFTEEMKEPVRRVFEMLADESLYPVYYHCWGGADRTGCLAYLLLALLGVSEEDRLLDFELTTLSVWGTRSRYMDEMTVFTGLFRSYPGRTDREKAESFLLSCGVRPGTVSRLRQNLLD